MGGWGGHTCAGRSEPLCPPLSCSQAPLLAGPHIQPHRQADRVGEVQPEPREGGSSGHQHAGQLCPGKGGPRAEAAQGSSALLCRAPVPGPGAWPRGQASRWTCWGRVPSDFPSLGLDAQAEKGEGSSEAGSGLQVDCDRPQQAPTLLPPGQAARHPLRRSQLQGSPSPGAQC